MQEAQEEADQDGNFGRTRMLSEGERIEMLNGLKTNWDRINKAYQTLSFTLDTPAKKKRKEEFEAQLEQLERDIERLSKRNVFVEEQADLAAERTFEEAGVEEGATLVVVLDALPQAVAEKRKA